MAVLSAYICVPCAVPEEARRGTRSPGTVVTDGCGCWPLNWGPLEEQPVASAEPSLALELFTPPPS